MKRSERCWLKEQVSLSHKYALSHTHTQLKEESCTFYWKILPSCIFYRMNVSTEDCWNPLKPKALKDAHWLATHPYYLICEHCHIVQGSGSYSHSGATGNGRFIPHPLTTKDVVAMFHLPGLKGCSSALPLLKPSLCLPSLFVWVQLSPERTRNWRALIAKKITRGPVDQQASSVMPDVLLITDSSNQ